jgi:ribosomal protein L40E
MLADRARVRAREEVFACHAEKFLGRKQVNACILCTNGSGQKSTKCRVQGFPRCMLSGQGHFRLKIKGFMESAPKKHCLVCLAKRPKSAERAGWGLYQ